MLLFFKRFMTIFIVITNSYALFGPEFGKKKPDKGYTFERKKSDPDLYQVASSSISFLFLLFVPVTPCRLFLVALWLLFCFCLEFVWEMADRWRHLQLKANRKWKKFIFSIMFGSEVPLWSCLSLTISASGPTT